MPLLGAPASSRAALLTLFVAAVALASFLGPFAAPATAHATLVSTTPPGDQVVERVPSEVAPVPVEPKDHFG